MPEYTAYGYVRSRTGNEIAGVAPSNTYPCRNDEWVVIGGNADGIFQRLMVAIDRPELAEDARFADNTGRAAHSKLLDDAIATWTSGRSLADVMDAMVTAAVPAGPIYSAADILADDPHFQARDMLLEMDVVVDGRARERSPSPASCPSWSNCRAGCAGSARSSASTRSEVLTDLLRMTDEEITRLRERKVV